METSWRQEGEELNNSIDCEQRSQCSQRSELSREQRRQVSLRSTKRILAPYIKARQKKKQEQVQAENKFFSYYIQKKPSILLCDVIYEGADLVSVFEESASILREITQSADVIVYLVDTAEDEIYELRDRSTEVVTHRVSFKIETESTVASHVAATKKWVKIRDLLEDVRFPRGLGQNEVTVKSVLCVPVLTPEEKCLAVIQLHRDMEDREYNETDLRIVLVMCCWIGATIYQSQQKVLLQIQQEINEYLLNICKCYFADATLLVKIIAEVVNFAKIALNAENAGLFVIEELDDSTFATYYEASNDYMDPDELNKKKIRIRTGADADVLGLVVITRLPVNIRNANKDKRVRQDIYMNYVVRSILCVPILSGNNVIGILQVLNKTRGVCFTKNDEILLNTFSVYCGFVLNYASAYEEMENTINYNGVYTEMLEYHMLPCVHDYYFLSTHPKPPSVPPYFFDFHFLLAEHCVPYIPQMVMLMFDHVCPKTFDNLEVGYKFVLTVRKCYRDLPYHNLCHAFYVLHTTFCIIKRNRECFSLTEARALMIAAYCHDIEHPGASSQFLMLDNHYLAQLYDNLILENHHFHVTVFIIQIYKLFQHLSAKEYEELISEIKFCIMATDLSMYLKKKKRMHSMCKRGVNWENQTERDLFKLLVVTMCDLSEYCKFFTESKNTADARFREHYAEGDKLKAMGLYPLSAYDSDKQSAISADQVQFLNLIVLPCAEMLSIVLPNCYSLYKEGAKNKQSWIEMDNLQGQKLWHLRPCLGDKKPKV